MIHIYTGDGKGKTTAAIGLAVRYAGGGKRVEVLQFLKDGTSSEHRFLKNTGINVTPCQVETRGFFWEMSDEEKENLKKETQKNFDSLKTLVKICDMIVLDELAGAVSNGLIEENKVMEFLKNFGKEKEIVITGRNVSKEIIEVADYVSEIKCIKHPFQKGKDAQKGIEY